MDFVNINPGKRIGLRQPYTIMTASHIFFVSHDEATNTIHWNMFMDNDDTKKEIEELLRSYLTNQ